MNDIVIISIALMGGLLFVLGANVTRHRISRGASGGDQAPSDPGDALLVAIRAHGNAAEYVPTLAVLLIVNSFLIDGWWLDALAVAATVARFAHGLGMLASGSLMARSPFKDGGALLTYVTGVALAVTALVGL
ncbi:MAG: MAPEG family protein [Propionibacteriales bacterium]|nr:MAPEG family protein [Propionibacteriales bacterium]